jgi:adenylate cyclase
MPAWRIRIFSFRRMPVLLRKSRFRRREPPQKKALELDDSLAEAHASSGLLATFDLEFDRSITELERAIQLDPNHATAHHWIALSLMALGQFDRAIAEGKRAIESRPALADHQCRLELALF